MYMYSGSNIYQTFINEKYSFNYLYYIIYINNNDNNTPCEGVNSGSTWWNKYKPYECHQNGLVISEKFNCID